MPVLAVQDINIDDDDAIAHIFTNITPPEGPAEENLSVGSLLTLEGALDMWHDESLETGPQCGDHCIAMSWRAGKKKLKCSIGKTRFGHFYMCYAGGSPLPMFGGQYKQNVGYHDNSEKDKCRKKLPLDEGAGPSGSPRGGGGSGLGRGGPGRRSRRRDAGRRGWR